MTDFGVKAPGYRLPETTAVGPVRLQISDLDRSLEYYESVLGLQRLPSDEADASLGASDGRPLVHLVEKVGIKPVPAQGAFGLYHFAILLPERAALARFLAHLVQLGLRPGMADHLVSEALYLHDPDGLGIEVYADRPRSAWRVRGHELQMVSDPIDVRGLLTAAVDVPWAGMPAGTTMGHVHLHVGDLAQAEAFYHQRLGFDKTVWSYPGALFLSAGGYHHHLGLNTWSPGPSATDVEARLLEWTLELPTQGDVDRLLAAVGGETTVQADAWGTHVRLTSA